MPLKPLLATFRIVIQHKRIRRQTGLKVRAGDGRIRLFELAAVRVVVAMAFDLHAVGVVDLETPG